MGDFMIGPAMPPGFRTESDSDDEADASGYGPSLPPGFDQGEGGSQAVSQKSASSRKAQIGPVLPPGFKHSDSGTSDSSDDSDDEDADKSAGPTASVIGPTLPPGFVPQAIDSDSESDVDPNLIGPMLSEAGGELSAAEDFERRAALMRSKILNQDKDKPKEREEWMTALPDKKLGASLGLTARTFRANDRTDGGYDASWTESPADKEKREQDILEGKIPAKKRKRDETQYVSSKRDELMEQQTELFNKVKDRGESLLDIHQNKNKGSSSKKKKEKDKKDKKDKKKKKEKKKDKDNVKQQDKPEVRRPFDRDVDLKVNRFDEAMRKQYIKQAHGLSGRFGHGQTKYV